MSSQFSDSDEASNETSSGCTRRGKKRSTCKWMSIGFIFLLISIIIMLVLFIKLREDFNYEDDRLEMEYQSLIRLYSNETQSDYLRLINLQAEQIQNLSIQLAQQKQELKRVAEETEELNRELALKNQNFTSNIQKLTARDQNFASDIQELKIVDYNITANNQKLLMNMQAQDAKQKNESENINQKFDLLNKSISINILQQYHSLTNMLNTLNQSVIDNLQQQKQLFTENINNLSLSFTGNFKILNKNFTEKINNQNSSFNENLENQHRSLLESLNNQTQFFVGSFDHQQQVFTEKIDNQNQTFTQNLEQQHQNLLEKLKNQNQSFIAVLNQEDLKYQRLIQQQNDHQQNSTAYLINLLRLQNQTFYSFFNDQRLEYIQLTQRNNNSLQTKYQVLNQKLATQNQTLTQRFFQQNSEYEQLISRQTQLQQRTQSLSQEFQQFPRFITPDLGWYTPWNGYQYKLTSTTQTWHAARRECQANGGDLAAAGMRNLDVRRLLKHILSDRSLWFGLNDIGRERTWVWVDGFTATASNIFWQPGEPNNVNEEDCAVMVEGSSNVKTFDARCAVLYYGICEKRLS